MALPLRTHLAGVQLILGAVHRHLVQHRRRDVLVRQLLKYLLSALAHVAGPREDLRLL